MTWHVLTHGRSLVNSSIFGYGHVKVDFQILHTNILILDTVQASQAPCLQGHSNSSTVSSTRLSLCWEQLWQPLWPPPPTMASLTW